MPPRRVAALAASAIATLALTACGGKAADDAGKPRSELSPAAAIDAAISDLATSSYAVEITSSGAQRESATVDPVDHTGTIDAKTSSQGGPMHLDAIMVGPDIWVKLDLGDRNDDYDIQPHSWMKLDPTKVSGDQDLPFDLGDFNDALDMRKLLADVSTKRADSNHFTGFIDLSRTSGVSAPSASDIASAGARAQHVPISVEVDQQGRLIEVNIDGAGISPDLAVSIRFSDYGAATQVTHPDDNQVIDTPATVYQLLSGHGRN